MQDKDYDYILEGREQNTIHLVSEDGVHAGEKQLVMTNSDYPADMSKHVKMTRNICEERQIIIWFREQGIVSQKAVCFCLNQKI